MALGQCGPSDLGPESETGRWGGEWAHSVNYWISYERESKGGVTGGASHI